MYSRTFYNLNSFYL